MLLLALCANSFAQTFVREYNFAGTDKDVYYDGLDGAKLHVKIGDETIVDHESLFYWDVVEKPEGAQAIILGKNESVADLIADKVGLYNCKLTRISIYGIQHEFVRVRATDEIAIVSVTPKKNCFKRGASVTLNDFDIVTSPPYTPVNAKVRLKPGCETLPIAYFSVNTTTKNKVFFEVSRHNSAGEEYFIESDVYATVTQLTGNKIDVGVNGKLSTLLAPFTKKEKDAKLTANIEKFVRAQHILMNSIDKFKGRLPRFILNPPPGAPKYVVPDIDIYGGLNLSLSSTCCDNEPTGVVTIGGNVTFKAGLKLNFPIPALSVPGVGGVFVVGAFGIQSSVSPKLDVYIGCQMPDIEIGLSTEGYLQVGASLALVDPSTLSVNLVAAGSIGANVKFSTNEAVKVTGANAKVNLLFYVTAMTLKVVNVSIPIIDAKIY